MADNDLNCQQIYGQQAHARKDHLTSMFLSKGCKMGDIQK